MFYQGKAGGSKYLEQLSLKSIKPPLASCFHFTQEDGGKHVGHQCWGSMRDCPQLAILGKWEHDEGEGGLTSDQSGSIWSCVLVWKDQLQSHQSAQAIIIKKALNSTLTALKLHRMTTQVIIVCLSVIIHNVFNLQPNNNNDIVHNELFLPELFVTPKTINIHMRVIKSQSGSRV